MPEIKDIATVIIDVSKLSVAQLIFLAVDKTKYNEGRTRTKHYRRYM